MDGRERERGNNTKEDIGEKRRLTVFFPDCLREYNPRYLTMRLWGYCRKCCRYFLERRSCFHHQLPFSDRKEQNFKRQVIYPRIVQVKRSTNFFRSVFMKYAWLLLQMESWIFMGLVIHNHELLSQYEHCEYKQSMATTSEVMKYLLPKLAQVICSISITISWLYCLVILFINQSGPF